MDRASTVEVEGGDVIEVYATSGKDEGKLLGYAIFRAGDWYPWKARLGAGVRTMTQVGRLNSADAAVKTICEQHGYELSK